MPIFIELIAAIQIGLSNPKYSLPLENPRVEREEYLEKPLTPITEITLEQKPKQKSMLSNYKSLNIEIIGTSDEQCVIYARRITGNQKIRGYAGNLQPEGYEAQVGAIALESGHVSVVQSVNGDTITVTEANYQTGYITRRVVNINNLKGFIY